MAWRDKKGVDITTSYPTGMPTYSKIFSEVKRRSPLVQKKQNYI